MEDLTKESLREVQKKIVEDFQSAYDLAPFELKGLCKDILTAQTTILRRLGYRKETINKSKKYSKKGFFKKDNKEVGDLEIDSSNKEIINKTKTGLFEPGEIVNAKQLNKIKNKPKKGMFEADELEAKKIEKINPKRLTQKQTSEIKTLLNEGFNAVQISDKLMINIKKVHAVLNKINKGVGNILATNNKKSSTSESEFLND